MPEIVCAGHICLDMTPKFPIQDVSIRDVFVGGKQTEVRGIAMSTGGSVANTGIALNVLGVDTPLIGKIGSDDIGAIIGNILTQSGANKDWLKVSEGETSSYSVVLALPGCDRIFLHDPAVNDTFDENDIDFDIIAQSNIFHFGYPQLMRQMYLNGGVKLQSILRRVKELGVTTSLDTAYPNPAAEVGQQDWRKILENLLPYVDIFLPSIEELLLMIDRPLHDALKAKSDDILEHFEIDCLPRLAQTLTGMGAKIVVIKCGTLGYYLKTSDAQALAQMGKGAPADYGAWAGQELFSGIYRVDDVKSATGAGDTSVAGFLTSLTRGKTPLESINIACATGALCVTEFGATDAMIPFEQIVAKIENGWEKRPIAYSGSHFTPDPQNSMLIGK